MDPTTPEGQQSQGLLKRVWDEFRDDDIPGQAAKVAYYAFLSLPPALLVIFGLAGFFGGEATAQWFTSELGTTLPGSASELVDEFVQQVVREQAPGPFSIGLLLAVWASSNVFMALADALNQAYDIEDERSWFKRRLISIGVMIAFTLLFLGGSALLLAGPAIAESFGFGSTMDAIWNILQWPLALLLVVGAFYIVYYILPARDQAADKGTLFKSALIGSLLWVLTTAAFRIYITNFGSYSETYGFLGAVIVLLLWLYITGIVVLTGGEFNSEMANS